jgi:hypothetical protein
MFRSGHDDDYDYDADSYDLSPAAGRDYGDPFADAANDSFGSSALVDDKPKRKIKVDDDLTYYDGDSLR